MRIAGGNSRTGVAGNGGAPSNRRGRTSPGIRGKNVPPIDTGEGRGIDTWERACALGRPDAPRRRASADSTKSSTVLPPPPPFLPRFIFRERLFLNVFAFLFLRLAENLRSLENCATSPQVCAFTRALCTHRVLEKAAEVSKRGKS